MDSRKRYRTKETRTKRLLCDSKDAAVCVFNDDTALKKQVQLAKNIRQLTGLSQ